MRRGGCYFVAYSMACCVAEDRRVVFWVRQLDMRQNAIFQPLATQARMTLLLKDYLLKGLRVLCDQFILDRIFFVC
jgi:hypothetical protein